MESAAEQAPGVEADRARPRSRWRRVRSSPWFHLLAVLVVLGLVHGFIAKPYRVPSGSMEQTLEIGDRVYANRLAYVGSGPERGDIVVFLTPDSWGTAPQYSGVRAALGFVGDLLGFGLSNHEALLKRTIGLPGERVRCCDAEGRVTVDGDPLEEPYLFEDYEFDSGALDCETTPASGRCFREIELGKDEYLMLGDHRSNSADSVSLCRQPEAAEGCARLVHRGDLVGEAAFRIWPLNRLGAP